VVSRRLTGGLYQKFGGRQRRRLPCRRLECPAPFMPVDVRETGMKGLNQLPRQGESGKNSDQRIDPSQRHSVPAKIDALQATAHAPQSCLASFQADCVPTCGSSGTTAVAPTFSVASGTYSSAQTVTISTPTSGSTIYYSTNGNFPSTSSTVYATPITVSGTSTVQAISAASGYTTSALGSASYIIQ
jgi:hypothetical protein